MHNLSCHVCKVIEKKIEVAGLKWPLILTELQIVQHILKIFTAQETIEYCNTCQSIDTLKEECLWSIILFIHNLSTPPNQNEIKSLEINVYL